MAEVTELPPIPASVMQKRMKYQAERGLHVIFDLPVLHIVRSELPGFIFKGMRAAFLMYGDSPDPYFRVAIGSDFYDDTHKSHFVEQGVFEKVLSYKVNAPEETIYERKDVSLPAAYTYFWVEFLFTANKTCEYHAEDVKLGEISDKVDITLCHKVWVWDDESLNNCRILEMHWTCPSDESPKFFPMNFTPQTWLCSPPGSTFASGGRVVVKGRYKQTNSQDPRIGFGIGKAVSDTGKPFAMVDKPDKTSGMIWIIFAYRGPRLMCSVDGKWSSVKTLESGWKTTLIRVTQNFEVHDVVVATGMNEWTHF